MIQRCDDANLALEPFAEPLCANLDGDFPAHARIARAIYLAHAARAERGDNFVRTEPGSAGKGHYLWNDSTVTPTAGS